jgi:transposase InsO family protein
VKIDAKTSAKFLFKNIFTRFGCPLEIVSDRGLHFLNETIQELTRIFFIKHRKTTPYNPKANGLTERANGIMVNILNKIISVHKTDWDIKLQSAIWAYRTDEKITTKRTPFYLVYGMDSIMPVEFEVPTYQTSTAERLSPESIPSPRLQEIEKLEEDRFFSLDETYKQQFLSKLRYDNKMKPVKIEEGDWVLMYNSQFKKFKGKLHTKWLGPLR